jgi:metallo-beta-lactamase class B
MNTQRGPTLRLASIIAVIAACLAVDAVAQTLPPGVSKEQVEQRLATDNKLFLKLAINALHWEVPAEPVHIAGPLYFVGTRGLGAFLFATPDGHVLMNTGMPSSGPMIEQSIRKLGFKPEDIRFLINGHAHIDHAGAFAYMKKLAPGAVVAVMDQEVPLMESGGRGDFKYGDDFAYEGVKVDRVLRTGDSLRVGTVLLTAYLTPGHTKGSTTWIATIVVDGKPMVVAFPDGAGFNPGYRLHKDPIYPGIEDDLRRTHHAIEMLSPDIWLAQHNEYYDLEGKRERARTEGLRAWMDPEGYRRWVAGKKRAFEDQVDREMKAAGSK